MVLEVDNTLLVSVVASEGNSRDGEDPNSLPVVIGPKHDSSLPFLTKWLKDNKKWLDAKLTEHGAVLLRGFNVDGATDMQTAVLAYHGSDLSSVYHGTSPRNAMDGTKYIFSAAEVPTHYPIAQHLEMSFLPEVPPQLVFGCLVPSQAVGGETAIADFRLVYRDLSPDLRAKLLEKGLLYTRTQKKTGSYFTYDVCDMKGWPEIFGTTDKAEVEELCAADGITDVTWKGETFISRFKSNAFQLHPITKEPVWFNHTQVFHWTTFSAELWFAFRRTLDWRFFFQFLLVAIFSLIKYGILRHRMALHATFGDGEDISLREISEIRGAVHRRMRFSRWEKGDLLLIDNFSTSHGRQPTYDKGRSIAVAWTNPVEKANELVKPDAPSLSETASGSCVESGLQEPLLH